MDVRAARIDPDAMRYLLHKDEDVYHAVISSLTSLKATIIGNFANNALDAFLPKKQRACKLIGLWYIRVPTL
jgi:hypothetical protein